MRAALHAREHAAARMLERHVEIFRKARMSRNRVEQARRDAVRITIEEANPVQVFDLRETFKKRRKAVAQAEVFAVERRVLADERNFAHAIGCQILRLAHDRFETAAEKLSAKSRDHAERAGMVASFIDFD